MFRPLAFLLAVFVLAAAIVEGRAADIDETYVKQDGSPWGQLLRRYFPTAGEFGKSYALVVGIGDYDHHPNLRAPVNDATHMRDFLRDQAGFDYIVTLTNAAATPERINRLMYVDLPGMVGSNDRFLFYFSGHGSTQVFSSGNKRGYLVLKDARPDDWDRMIAMPRVLDWAENFSAARHVLFLLDACFSGLAAIQAKSGEHREQTLERLMDPAHLLVTAGTENQESFTVGDSSLFTSAFIQAVQDPAADSTRDGIVSLDEIEIYVKDQLDRQRARGLDMTPTRWKTRSANNAGDFFFLSPQYLNARIGNPADAKLEKGEPTQAKGPAAEAKLPPLPPDIVLDPVEQEMMVLSTTAVRAAPSSASPRLATLERGTIVYVRERVRGQSWVRLEHDGQAIGFMLMSNLGMAPPRPNDQLVAAPARTALTSGPSTLLQPPDPAAAESALGLSPSDWTEIQRDLTALGYSITADGRPGPQTRAAVAEWQIVAAQVPTRFLTADQRRQLASEARARRAEVVAQRRPGMVFRDARVNGQPCPKCPEMVVVPAGSFMMGSPESEPGRYSDEGPRHRVSIAYDLAVGRYEITFDEWDACVAARKCRHLDAPWERGRQPVVNVSWNEATTYTDWLSQVTGQEYRLPSESEWEYTARGNTNTSFWMGEHNSRTQVNYINYDIRTDGPYDARTVRVDRPGFEANPFGLYHVHGNVWEWVEDCYHSSYSGAPTSGLAWTSDCSDRPPHRILRGGSWNTHQKNARSGSRYRVVPETRDSLTGFRVVRTLAH